jgi:hypothetical protein
VDIDKLTSFHGWKDSMVSPGRETQTWVFYRAMDGNWMSSTSWSKIEKRLLPESLCICSVALISRQPKRNRRQHMMTDPAGNCRDVGITFETFIHCRTYISLHVRGVNRWVRNGRYDVNKKSHSAGSCMDRSDSEATNAA